MELVYLKYLKDGRHLLLLELGSRNGKICGLLTEKVSDTDRAKILSAKAFLENMTVDRRISWLRDHCPASYRSAYREIHKSNAHEVSRHGIKK